MIFVVEQPAVAAPEDGGRPMTNDKLLDVKGIHAPKTKHGINKMQLLLESAERLFSRSGFFEVSVSDICKEAHTAVGTFYIYFDSKTDG